MMLKTDELLKLQSICDASTEFVSDSNVYRENDYFCIIVEYYNGAVAQFNGSFDDCLTWLRLIGLTN